MCAREENGGVKEDGRGCVYVRRKRSECGAMRVESVMVERDL